MKRQIVNKIWSPEEVDQLKKMMAEGMSMSVIAAKLKTTRSSVAGKINRMELRRLRDAGFTEPWRPGDPKPASYLRAVYATK